MNDRTALDSVQVPTGTSRTRVRLRWPSRKSLLVLAACLAGSVVAVGMWQVTLSTRPATGAGRSVVTGSPGMAAKASSEAPPPAPVAAQSGSPASAAKSADLLVTPPISDELSALKDAHDRLAQRAVAADQRLVRIESAFAQLTRQVEEQQVALAQVRARASDEAPRPRIAQAKPQRPAAQPRPQVLSVDMWNGQPSVSVLTATEVRFFSEGDVVADALVKRADPVNQRVEFVTASGVVVTAPTAGEAR